MIIKRDQFDSGEKWCTQAELPILDCLADATVYCITGGYFFHTKIEALGFDYSEMKALFISDYEGKSTDDIYDHHGEYRFETRKFGDILQAEREELRTTAKRKTLKELKNVIALMEGDNNFKK